MARRVAQRREEQGEELRERHGLAQEAAAALAAAPGVLADGGAERDDEGVEQRRPHRRV